MRKTLIWYKERLKKVILQFLQENLKDKNLPRGCT